MGSPESKYDFPSSSALHLVFVVLISSIVFIGTKRSSINLQVSVSRRNHETMRAQYSISFSILFSVSIFSPTAYHTTSGFYLSFSQQEFQSTNINKQSGETDAQMEAWLKAFQTALGLKFSPEELDVKMQASQVTTRSLLLLKKSFTHRQTFRVTAFGASDGATAQ